MLCFFGKTNDIKEIIEEFTERFRGGEGVLGYEVYQDEEDSHAFVHVMKFKDEGAEEVKEFAAKLYSFCQIEPKFTRLKVVDGWLMY